MEERKTLISEKPFITTILRARKPLFLPNVRAAITDFLDDFLTRMRRPSILAEVATYIITRGLTPAIRQYFEEIFSGKRPFLERLLQHYESRRKRG